MSKVLPSVWLQISIFAVKQSLLLSVHYPKAVLEVLHASGATTASEVRVFC